MIVSASRRTDIPAFYADWFFNRIQAGFLYVRNPRSAHMVSKISLCPEVVDCLVFWTKDPRPMLDRLAEINDFKYYFQFTVNPYDQGLERLVPERSEIIDTFKKLSDTLGPQRVVWRYDPVLVSDTIDIPYHIHRFERMARQLEGYTDRCVVSFIDSYKKTEKNLRGTSVRELSEDEIHRLCEALSPVGHSCKMVLQSCAENIDLSAHGIVPGNCIDKELIENIIGHRIAANKDKGQRPACGCIESIDIGEYDTCMHNCLYCYANLKNELALRKNKLHDPRSPLLIGEISDRDIIRERKVSSLIAPRLFE